MPTTAHADTRLTYEDFLLLPDDGKRHEIINGVHYVTPSPTMQHQQLLGCLHYELEHYLRQRPGLGQVFLSPLDVVLSDWDVVEPDLLLVLRTQENILTEQNVQGAPAIVVEILSPGTRRRDQTVKRKLFERSGVVEYWLIDPRDRVVTQFVRDGDRFTSPTMLTPDGVSVLTTALLPGFSLPLTDLFRRPAG